MGKRAQWFKLSLEKYEIQLNCIVIDLMNVYPQFQRFDLDSKQNGLRDESSVERSDCTEKWGKGIVWVARGSYAYFNSFFCTLNMYVYIDIV